MTYHSAWKWTFGDAVTDELIDEVVGGLEYHKGLNDGEQYTPDAYMRMCHVDALIYLIGRILDTYARGEDLDLDKFTEKSPESAREVIRRVMERMANGDE